MNVSRSVCGSLSVALLLLGVGLEAVLALLPNVRIASSLLLIALALFLLGIGFALAGIIRREPLGWLSVIGFGLNLVLIALCFLME